MRTPIALAAAFSFCLAGTATFTRANEPAGPAIAAVRFNRDVRPVLSDNCFSCHGPDASHRKADLRLDTEAGLFGKRDGGAAVVRGKAAASAVWSRVTAADPDDLMPPAESHKKLTADQKATIRRWIEQGAPWEPHWSLAAPVRPAVPDVANKAWVRTPIDAFVLAKLEAAGLSPAPEADRRTLARRLSFDLTGLPPSPAEVDAFVADAAPGAYEAYVDRLMAKPAWGEHRGRYWLDAARYGDTHGVHNDNYREMWPYRDQVIAAFNRNQPFDRFVVEQLAGDLLPGRTLDQQVASGFQRCNITTSEGGSINDEVLAVYAKDRVETFGTVFLGLTAGCAACHDHKFDPLSQKEFYQLAAFFRNTTQGAMDGNAPDTPPMVVVPSAADRPRWDELAERQADLSKRRADRKAASDPAFDAWLKAGEHRRLASPVDPAEELAAAPFDEGAGDAAARLGGELKPVPLPPGVAWTDGPAKGSKAVRFDAKASIELPISDVASADLYLLGDFGLDSTLSIGAWVLIPPEDGSFAVASRLGSDDRKATPGWSLSVESRTAVFRVVGDGGATIEVRGPASGRPAAGKWVHLLATYDGTRRAGGMRLHINGKEEPPPAPAPDAKPLDGAGRNAGPVRLGGDGKRDLKGGGLADVRLVGRALSADEAASLAKWSALRRAVIDKPADKLAAPERVDLQLVYLSRYDPAYAAAGAALAAVEAEQRAIRGRSPVTHVMAERPGPAKANVLFRGQYDQPKDEVLAGTPAAMSAYPAEFPRDRLGLAWWVVDARNPLTARVTVNRFWQELFGTGLVRTSEDFGVMGENPSHPELLDWLAVEFRSPPDGSSPWDVKRFYQLMVTSSAYRQAAVATPAALRADPQNRLLSRGPRFRMDAEMLRDAALAASGLLREQVGGPSVKPYQPPGVWEAVAMSSSNTRSYKEDAGEKLYRRSLYTFWKRSAPPASMDIFNAPGREVCTVRRERTNTPLQALVTLNDPQWVEAARRLAERAIGEAGGGGDRAGGGGGSFDRRLDFVTARVLSRPMDDRERAICRGCLDEFAATFAADEASAKKLIATGASKPDENLKPADLAAWTLLVSQVMNTDEALNK